MIEDNVEVLVATLAKVFKLKNDQQTLEVLIHCKPYYKFCFQDWGISHYELRLSLPSGIFEQVYPHIGKLQEIIKGEASRLIIEVNEELDNVLIIPKIEATANWREEIRSLSETQFGIPPKDSQYKADIFMLMPFKDDQLQQVYNDHVCTVANRLRMTIKRGDDFFSQTSVIRDIWGAINAAEIIIADCTLRNPNVFYELGIAHTLAKKTIMITRNEDDIPFDLRQWRYIKYVFTPRGMTSFEQELAHAIEKISNNISSGDVPINNIGDIPF